MLITACIWCSPLMHSLCRPPLVVFLFLLYRKKTPGLPNFQTQLLDHLTPAFDCFWNNARGRRIQDPLFLLTEPWLQALILYKPLDPSWKWGTVLEAQSSPLHGLRIKATFLFPPNSASVFFYSVFVSRECQDFGQQHYGLALFLDFWPTRNLSVQCLPCAKRRGSKDLLIFYSNRVFPVFVLAMTITLTNYHDYYLD